MGLANVGELGRERFRQANCLHPVSHPAFEEKRKPHRNQGSPKKLQPHSIVENQGLDVGDSCSDSKAFITMFAMSAP
eukprot:m.199628 g.199628  ORF g.199628 m.199628 type:complete len:77 (-) comp32740_c4_seq3:747-977(-)